MEYLRPLATALSLLLLLPAALPAEDFDPESEQALRMFLQLLLGQKPDRDEAFETIVEHWRPTFAPMVLEVTRFTREPSHRGRLIRLLESKTGQRHGEDFDAWYHWLWNREPELHAHYADFKAALYGLIDPKFAGYFSSDRVAATCRWPGFTARCAAA